MRLDETFQNSLVRTGLNENELAVLLVQLVHLHAQGRPENQTE